MSKHLAEEFLKIVTGKTGTVAKRFTEQYFMRNNFGHIWKNVIDATQFLPEDSLMMRRIYCLLNEIDHFETCPTCKIGTSRIVGKSLNDMAYSAFCSAPCMLADEERGKKISAGWKNVDKESANEKRAVTMTEKYGTAYNSQREDIHHIWERSKLSDLTVLDRIEDRDWLYEQYVTLGKPSTEIAKELGIDYDTVITRLSKFDIYIRHRMNRSYPEKMIFEFISEISPDATSNTRNIISPYELDIVVESSKLAVELNGIYWHSFDHTASHKEKNKHLDKTLAAKDAGYNLIHIWETEWNDKKEIVQSIISSRLGVTDKIFARKTTLVEVSKKDEKEFLEKSHIQGFTPSGICYGLEYEGELVQLMSFGKPRFNKKYDWELIRSCNKLNTTVVGGASKLMSHFTKNNSGSVICYSDRRFGEGNVYLNIGFTFKESLAPGYSYVDNKAIYSRFKFQKAKLEGLLKVFDESLSEEANMFANNYRKLWDCGQNVYVIE